MNVMRRRQPSKLSRAGVWSGFMAPWAAAGFLSLAAIGAVRGSVEGVVPPEMPLQGRLLFEQKGCNQCHGIGGPERGIGPDLGEGHFRGSFLDLGASLWNHVPGMSVAFQAQDVTWPELSVGEVVELTAFLYFIEYLGRPGDPAAGEKIFKAKGCAGCHTVGRGRAAGVDLTRLDRFASPLYVGQAIWAHGPSMLEALRRRRIPPPTFDVGDLADLSAFIRQAAERVPEEPVLLAPGNPRHGQEVFHEKSCVVCHGAPERGGSQGPDLSASDLHRSAEAIAGMMWNHAFEMHETMLETGVRWPELTPTEFADLVAYLYFLSFSDPPGDALKGARVFTTRSCGDCHGSGPEGAHPGPDLTGAEVLDSPASLVAAMWNHAPMMREAILEEGRPWPELTGDDLRNLLAFLHRGSAP